MKRRCSHINRSGPLAAGLPGASLGQCQDDALEGFTVCFEHVNKEAPWFMCQQLRRALRLTERATQRARHERDLFKPLGPPRVAMMKGKKT